MPRKKKASMSSYIADDEDFGFEEKYHKEEFDNRAPRNAANARERARMRVLSKAFCRLKTTLPWVPADTKLSKLDTLRLAATYIAHLRAVLRDDADTHSETTKFLSLTLSWPFAIQSSDLPILTNDDCDPSATATSSNSTNVPYRLHKNYPNSHKMQTPHELDHENQSRRHYYDSYLKHYYNDA